MKISSILLLALFSITVSALRERLRFQSQPSSSKIVNQTVLKDNTQDKVQQAAGEIVDTLLAQEQNSQGVQLANQNEKRAARSVLRACAKATVFATPSEYCWKKETDFGVQPICQSGFVRRGYYCLPQKCKAGLIFFQFQCYQPCPSGWIEKIYYCQRWNWRTKSYDLVTKANKIDQGEQICPKGTYKFGSKCYRDCKSIGMVNCGLNACVQTYGACFYSLARLKSKVKGVQQALEQVLSFNSGQTMKAGYQILTKMSKEVDLHNLNKIMGIVQKRWKGKSIDQVKKLVTKSAINQLKGEVIDKSMIQSYCGVVSNAFKENIQNRKSVYDYSTIDNSNLGFDFSKIDTSAILNDIGRCEGKMSFMCAYSIGKMARDMDIYGLATLSAIFMKSQCQGI